MKWVTKQRQLEKLYYTEDHQGLKFRIITRFLFFPREINMETRWLCKETIIQKVSYNVGGLLEPSCYYWQDISWMDKFEPIEF